MPAQDTRSRVARPVTAQPTERRALLVSDRWTFLPGDVAVPTPAGSLAAGLGALVSRIAATFTGEGVLILDDRAARQVGLPVTSDQLDQADEVGADHPALADLRSAGWTAARLGPWMTLYAPDRPRIYIGILPLISPKDCPIICPWPHDTLDALTEWFRLVGSSFYGAPGWAGTEALRSLADAGKSKRPTFKPAGEGPEEAYESPFLAEHFKGSLPTGMRYAGAYDARMAYLSAALVVRLAPWSLKHTGKVSTYDQDKAGWWLVKFGPWNDRRIPNPAGYGHEGDGEARWVTGPTLTLIDELVASGVHAGYEILDSWTAPIINASNGRPLKIWAEKIRDGLYSELPGPSGDAVRAALKGAYRQTIGSMNNAKAPIYRPDWHFAVIAMCRVNLWRKMWGIGQHLDRWPLWIETDNVWYPIATNDPIAEAPVWTNTRGGNSGMVIGARLGNCQVKGWRDLRPVKVEGDAK